MFLGYDIYMDDPILKLLYPVLWESNLSSYLVSDIVYIVNLSVI